jgi:hypothetical protein
LIFELAFEERQMFLSAEGLGEDDTGVRFGG